MMEIEMKRTLEPKFCEISVGSVFIARNMVGTGEDVYMKICETSNSNYKAQFNAVSLKTGFAYNFDKDEYVLSVKARVVVE